MPLPMLLDLAILVLIAALAWRGALAGPAAAGLQLVALPLAYGAALAAGHVFGPALARETGASGLLTGIGAGTCAFLAVQMLAGVGVRALRERGEGASAAAQAGGALCGALRGALFALPILWLGGLAEGARVSGARPDLPDLSGAQLPAIATRALGAGAAAVVDERAAEGRAVLQLAARPTETVAALQRVLADPRLAALQRDAGFWRDVEAGAVSRALARPSARQLVADPSFRRGLAAVGAVSPEAGRDARRFEAELSAALASVGPRLHALRNDPALEELLADPALRARLEQGDAFALLGDARFRALVSRASQ